MSFLLSEIVEHSLVDMEVLYRVLPKPYEVWVMTSSVYLILVWTKVVSLHSQYFLVQSQLWKHQDNVWNLFKLTIKTPERRQWRRYGVFIVNVEQISHIVLVFPLLTLNKQMLAGWVLLLPKFIDNSSCQLEHFCVIIWEWLVKSFKIIPNFIGFCYQSCNLHLVIMALPLKKLKLFTKTT